MKLLLQIPAVVGMAIFSLMCSTIFSCGTPEDNIRTFLGEEEAVERAEQMLTAIGGKEAWCKLKSLYIKAEHREPQMDIPYQSEIWRDIERFDVVIEQQNDSFHVKAVINSQGGTIRYYDQRDTVRILTQNQLAAWEFDHAHNIYVLLHHLSCSPQDFTVKLDAENSLTFYRDSTFYTSFELDEQLRPYKFYVPNIEGEISGSVFTRWEVDGELVHSAGGHPLDSNFVYDTEIWQPSEAPMRSTFSEAIFEIE